MDKIGARMTRSRSTPAPSPPSPLPRELTERLLGQVDRMARDMTRRLAGEIDLPPAFRRVGYLRLVMAACREGLTALLRQLHDGTRIQPSDLTRLGRAGAQQAEMGVPLEVLLRAYRLAARVVWHEVIGEAAREELLDPATAVVLSEQLLEYLDEISSAVGRAYLDTRERLVRQRDRDRDHLLQRLLAGDSADELRRLAAALDLQLSPPYRVLACTLDVTGGAEILDRAWRSSGALLVAEASGPVIALVPARADVDTLCREALRACPGAPSDGLDPLLRVGTAAPAQTLGEVAGAARRARRALAVGRRLRPDAMVHDDAELGAFAVLADAPDELRAFVERRLGPLLEGGRRSELLLATLEALLATGSLADAAASLGVHRHTVVYRAARLRETLGPDLDDPDGRHLLWLALQGARLLPA